MFPLDDFIARNIYPLVVSWNKFGIIDLHRESRKRDREKKKIARDNICSYLNAILFLFIIYAAIFCTFGESLTVNCYKFGRRLYFSPVNFRRKWEQESAEITCRWRVARPRANGPHHFLQLGIMKGPAAASFIYEYIDDERADALFSVTVVILQSVTVENYNRASASSVSYVSEKNESNFLTDQLDKAVIIHILTKGACDVNAGKRISPVCCRVSLEKLFA